MWSGPRNLSTALMYSHFNDSKINHNSENDLDTISEFDFGNDFESIAIQKSIEIKNIFKFLSQLDKVIFSRLTGSGSCIYATFDSIDFAKEANLLFKDKFPYLWTKIAENNI